MIQELYDSFRKTHLGGEIEEMLIFHFLNSIEKEIRLLKIDYGNETIKVEKTGNGFIFSLKIAEEKYEKIMEMDKERKRKWRKSRRG